MSLDFAPILKHVPFIQHLWRHFAEKVTFFSQFPHRSALDWARAIAHLVIRSQALHSPV